MKRTGLFLLLTAIALNISAQYYIFDSIPDNLKKRANAVIRSHQCLFTITSPGKAVMKYKQAVTILNDLANSYRFLEVPYNDYSRVSNLRGIVYDEQGNIVKVFGVADIFDKSAVSGGAFYSDERVKSLTFPLYKYPYTIEFEYEITFTSLLNYPSWIFQESPLVSVQRSGIQIVIPKDMKMRYYEEDLKNKVDSVIVDENKIYSWQEENLPAYSIEDFFIRRVYSTPAVYCAPMEFEFGGFKGSMSSWKDFGMWVYNINKGRDDIAPGDISEVKMYVAGIIEKRDKIRMVYEYMQSRTRYVSIQIGIGGYRTALASDVSKNGFGDCKALVNYTKSLLREVGIESFYTLVKAIPYKDIKTKFVDNDFNHVILCVPDGKDTIWLECTNQTNPFNYLSTQTADKHVLLITQQGGKIVKTPDFGKYVNVIRRTGSLYMNVLGNSSGKISNYYSGSRFAPASGRYSGQSEDELRRSLYSGLKFTDFGISSVSYSESKSEDPSAILAYNINIKSFASVNGPKMYFNPVLSVQDYIQELPVHLSNSIPEIVEDSIVYNLPLNYSVEFAPENVFIQNEFGKYSYQIEPKSDRIIFHRTLKINESDITIDRYESFKNFINIVAKTDRQKVILARTNS